MQEILDADATDLRGGVPLVGVRQRKQDMNRLHAEKEQLYRTALECYENGEVNSALSKLERLLELIRTSPDAASPDRDAEYQTFYNQVRSDREASRNAHAEGRRCLAHKNFDRAIEICTDFLNRYPGDPLFQALQLEAEEGRRQQKSAWIAEISRRAAVEPDLDRRVNILEKAMYWYPDEAHLQQLLRLTRDRRDLVNTIIHKARQYEDHCQFDEALDQWDTLRNIYPQYTGLESECERLARRRAEQTHQSHAAGKQAQQDLGKKTEAALLLRQGERLYLERSYAESVSVLREAFELDPASALVREALLKALVEQARSVVGEDWRAAEPLIQQALSIDPDHPFAKSLQAMVLDYKRKETADECVARARDLRAAGDPEAALNAVEEALRSFPNEPRLEQLCLSLKRSLPESERPASGLPAAKSDTASPDHLFNRSAVFPRPLEPPPLSGARTPPRADPVLPSSWAGFASDVRFVWRQISSVLPRFDRGQWVAVTVCPTLVAGIIGWELMHGRPQEPAPATSRYAFYVGVKPQLSGAQYLLDGKPLENDFPSQFSAGSHTAEVRAEGYETAHRTFLVAADPKAPRSLILTLTPEPLRLRIASDLKSGQVLLDNAASDLQDGAFMDDHLALSTPHTVMLTQNGKTYLNVAFAADPGRMAILTPPIKASHVSVVVVSNLAARTVVYSSNPALKARTGDHAAKRIPLSGLELSGIGSGTEAALVDGAKERPLPIDMTNAPSLTLLVISNPETATLQVEVNVPDAEVAIEGAHKPRHLRGKSTTYQLAAGKYTILVAKDGYNPERRPVELSKGDSHKLTIELSPLAPKPSQAPPSVSSLSITGGTPGARVFVDGQSVGALDSNGSLSLDKITPAKHRITLRKDGFEDKEIGQASFIAGHPTRILGVDATLLALGSLAFKITPANASIRYKRDGEAEEHEAGNNSPVPLRQGRYSVRVAAPGFLPKSDAVSIDPGKAKLIDWVLTPAPQPCNYDKSAWRQTQDGWMLHKNGDFAFVCADGAGVLALEVKPPRRGVMRKRVLEFRVDYRDANDYVDYTLEENRIERKVYVGGVSQQEYRKSGHMFSGSAWPLRIVVQSDRIRIISGGKMLDDVARSKPSAPRGQTAFKGEVQIQKP